ncbi:hypothetical protein [Longispora fulva]|nr:hypothetical protein [Longispora fulva]
MDARRLRAVDLHGRHDLAMYEQIWTALTGTALSLDETRDWAHAQVTD